MCFAGFLLGLNGCKDARFVRLSKLYFCIEFCIRRFFRLRSLSGKVAVKAK